ncbi:MAG: hypothetical protein MUD12_15355 [Spirochaetes bacterium]|jgi:hypothetical protein|nr:hypothetical protein [Spirochaetota bacterium]
MNTNKISEYFLIIVSIAVIWLPNIAMVFNFQAGGSMEEKRKMAKLPEIGTDWNSISKYPQALMDFYGDNYGFRKFLIKSYNVVVTKYIKSISKDKVLFGKNNWLYWTGENSLSLYRAIKPLREDDLASMKKTLEERQEYCRRNGIKYIFMVVPDKDTIYPEHLPDWMVKANETSYLDQFKSYMDKKSTFKFLDIRDDLVREKKNSLVYYQTDTHWNDLGAFVGYSSIMKNINESHPGIRAMKLSDFDQKKLTIKGGDLAIYAGISEQYSIESTSLQPKKPRSARIVELDGFYLEKYPKKSEKKSDPVSQIGIFAMEVKNPSLPKAVVFRDSFSNSLIPFLAEHFRRSVYFWYVSKTDDFDFALDIIEHEKPDIVITEVGERIFNEIKKNPESVKNASGTATR